MWHMPCVCAVLWVNVGRRVSCVFVGVGGQLLFGPATDWAKVDPGRPWAVHEHKQSLSPVQRGVELRGEGRAGGSKNKQGGA